MGVAPCEIMHGVKPKLQAALAPDHIERSILNADLGSTAHLEAIATAHNRARQHMIACREAHAKRMRGDLKNVLRSSKPFMQGDIMHSTPGGPRKRSRARIRPTRARDQKRVGPARA